MDRRTTLAIVLCFFIFMFWQKYFIEPNAGHAVPPAAQTAQTSSGAAQAVAPDSSTTGVVPAVAQPAQNVQPALSAANQNDHSGGATGLPALIKMRLSTSLGDLYVSNGHQFIDGWTLKDYNLKTSFDLYEHVQTLLGMRAPVKEFSWPVDLASVTNDKNELEFALDDPSFAYLNSVQGKLSEIPDGVQWTYDDSQIKLTRIIRSEPNKPFLNVQILAEFKAKHPAFGFVSLSAHGFEKDPGAQDRQLLYWTNKAIERVPLKSSSELKEIGTEVKYIGAADRYFLFTAISEGAVPSKGLIQPTGSFAGKISLVYPISGNSINIPLKVYFGPKDLEILRSVDPLLDLTVDFGWFTAIAYPLLWFLKLFFKYLHNYGLAIILLTLILKVVTYPLTYKSMKSMKEMAKIQPQLQKIREQYKDDKEALNREMLVMMRSHGYNPMAGCLPMLLQMPIFFALYRVLYQSIELFHAPFALWITDLSSKDPYFVTPVLLSATMFIQQKLSPATATDPAQQKMMQFMPLMFGFFMLTLPSGLTLYMLTNALASIAQQMILNKKFAATSVVPATSSV